MAQPRRLFLVRHGETAAQEELRYCGHADIPLSERGRGQARSLAGRLSGETFEVIYSSDLRRCLETAEAIAAGRGIPLIPCPELRELDFGLAEGLTFEEIASRFPETARLWREASPRLRFPEGESLEDLFSRIGRFLERLGRDSFRSAVIVAHDGSLRALLCRLLGEDIAAWWRHRFPPAGVKEIYISR